MGNATNFCNGFLFDYVSAGSGIIVIERPNSIGEAWRLLIQMEERIEQQEETLQKIQQWCDAYPIDIFTEPDWEKVSRKLGPKLLTQISASNMRHVINGVSELIND